MVKTLASYAGGPGLNTSTGGWILTLTNFCCKLLICNNFQLAKNTNLIAHFNVLASNFLAGTINDMQHSAKVRINKLGYPYSHPPQGDGLHQM